MAKYMKRYPPPLVRSGRKTTGLSASYVVKDGYVVGKTATDMGAFKGLQRAANQWFILNAFNELALVPVDGQVGEYTYQAVRDGIILARSQGSYLSQQEPANVQDLALHAETYARTLASLAGVTVDDSPLCRKTDHRGDLKACSNPTDPPPSSLVSVKRTEDGETVPIIDTDKPSPAVAKAGLGWWWLVILGGGAFAISMMSGDKRKKKTLSGCRSCGTRKR